MRSSVVWITRWLTAPVASRIAAIVLGCSVLLSLSPARALSVDCIEASRYKYIYRIFNNDPARFAAYFGADPKQLPSGETCRALLVTGRVDRIPRDSSDNDVDRLVEAIRKGRGWVSTLYLASPGGSVAAGLRLGEITRMFWLNTSAIEGEQFDYVPDFLGPSGPGSPAAVPPDLQAGWRDYQAATQAFARAAAKDGSARKCASACTFVHAAGIYRYGSTFFHRARRSAPTNQPSAPQSREPSMSDLLEGLQESEDRVLAFYRKMDVGDAGIQAFQNTATETTQAVNLPLMPRYIGDYLKKQCFTAARHQDGPKPRIPFAQRPFPDGFADIQCISASNSRERLTQFAKLCPNDCDRRQLFHEATVRMRALLPDKQDVAPPRRQGIRGYQPYGR